MSTVEASSKLSRAAKYVFWTMLVPAMLTVGLLAAINLVFAKEDFSSDEIAWPLVFVTVPGILGIAFFGAWLSAKKTRSFANDFAARYLARFIFALAAADIAFYFWIVTVIKV